MGEYDKYFNTNKALWDSKTPIHIDSKFYDMDAFMKGANSLRRIELAEIPDVQGKKILHAQCHFGQDTLSLERMGAKCTGIDLSGEAIRSARKFRDELGLNSRFIECNIYDLEAHVDDVFDMVFTSYGVIAWLPDLDKWAEILCNRLKEGGIFYMAEFHPVLYMFDWEKKRLEYEYFNNGEAKMEINSGTYVDSDADIELKEYFWQHSLSEVISALLKAGMTIRQFNEYDYSPYNCFENMEFEGEQHFVYRQNGIALPHVFTILCEKR
ncbi:MAG: methyltransferase domain-containing protein [Saprospiraceae bacterium]|nr:methyltransferase domain-containing protein [Saprospiraceae bacterium]